PPGDLASFIQINMGVGPFHCIFLASDNPLVSFASRTSSLNPPGYICESHKIDYGTIGAIDVHRERHQDDPDQI
ncbi:hypothetical protein, partial [Rhizobium sp. R693]|uniref:hypothetical protein n=1 Tax=Rhizobium sp. R693 TaxID=1764276 RepID=UPI001AEFFC85